MNTNVKLIQSVLGLGLGMWMLACGGVSYGITNSEKLKEKAPLNVNPSPEKLAKKTVCTNQPPVSTRAKFAFEGKRQKAGADTWFIESYK